MLGVSLKKIDQKGIMMGVMKDLSVTQGICVKEICSYNADVNKVLVKVCKQVWMGIKFKDTHKVCHNKRIGLNINLQCCTIEYALC